MGTRGIQRTLLRKNGELTAASLEQEVASSPLTYTIAQLLKTLPLHVSVATSLMGSSICISTTGILFYHGILIQQLSPMCEGRYPLAALHRSMIRMNRYIGMTPTITYKQFRGAWNAFIRLLEIDWRSIFTYTICGPHHDTIIYNQTDLGFRKDFLGYCASHESENIDVADTDCPIVSGTKHKDRVYINKNKCRKLLLDLISKDTLDNTDLATVKSLCTSIQAILAPVNVIPSQFKPFLRQLTYNLSPARGIAHKSTPQLSSADHSTRCHTYQRANTRGHHRNTTTSSNHCRFHQVT